MRTEMYSGFFLNLARNERRHRDLTRHLGEIGASGRYQRIEAIDGSAVFRDYPTSLSPGELGLWLTHEMIAGAVHPPDLHLHIIDDDVIFAKQALEVLDGLLQYADAQLGPWDLIFTELGVPPSSDVFRRFYASLQANLESSSYSLLDLAAIGFSGSTSLLINKASVQKYARLLSGQWNRGVPIDLHIRDMVHQGQLKAYVVLPFPTSISPENLQSDIRGRFDKSHRVCDILRRAFFQDADQQALVLEMEALTKGITVPPLVQIFLKAATFSLSDQWQDF